MTNDWQLIVVVGAEGGTIKLLGKELSSGDWIFRKAVNEMSFDDVDDEPIQLEKLSKGVRTLKSTLINNSGQADSWAEALQLLDQYPWPRLIPREIHPAFGKRVWVALQNKYKQAHKNESKSFRLDRWAKYCFPGYAKQVITLATWLQNSNYTTILTGAGMSTESNIPDFRSKDGWWKNIDPRTVATIEAMENNYNLFHEFYSMRINGLKECQPHRGHEILAEWEHKGLIQAIATQNVEGFHTAAGNRHVYELHGSIRSFRCANCSKQITEEQFLNKEICNQCGGNLRPNVVVFGESLPEASWRDSISHIRKSDLVIVIGTSLEVYPASRLPKMTNGKTVYINFEVDEQNSSFDLTIKGKAGEVLQQVDELVK
ncbi:SIR2 family NAD-dependent protein deacylase [Schinkia sp. CFF1]